MVDDVKELTLDLGEVSDLDVLAFIIVHVNGKVECISAVDLFADLIIKVVFQDRHGLSGCV